MRNCLMMVGIESKLQCAALDPKHPHRRASEAEILTLMPELPLVQGGDHFEVILLIPYPDFERLFGE